MVAQTSKSYQKFLTEFLRYLWRTDTKIRYQIDRLDKKSLVLLLRGSKVFELSIFQVYFYEDCFRKKILKSGKIFGCFSFTNSRPIVTCGARVSRVPPHHILPAFLNLHGTFFSQKKPMKNSKTEKSGSNRLMSKSFSP